MIFLRSPPFQTNNLAFCHFSTVRHCPRLYVLETGNDALKQLGKRPKGASDMHAIFGPRLLKWETGFSGHPQQDT
jgi:hypothetical protein